MQLNSTEIADLIKQRIEQFKVVTQAHNEGTIVAVNDGIVRVHGLADVMQGEMLDFGGGLFGLALNLERDSVGAIVLGPYEHLSEGMKVHSTGRILEVPVGKQLLGRVVDSLGQPIDGRGPISEQIFYPVEKIAPGVIARQGVSQPIQTGYKAVDSMIPIGRGQRELIIGDRQVGKTALAIDTIINQRNYGVRCIYVAIGQKASTIAAVVRKLEEEKALENTIVVVASASDTAALQYIAPYAGCAMGEYFLDQLHYFLMTVAVCFISYAVCSRMPEGGIPWLLARAMVCGCVAAAGFLAINYPTSMFKKAARWAMGILRPSARVG